MTSRVRSHEMPQCEEIIAQTKYLLPHWRGIHHSLYVTAHEVDRSTPHPILLQNTNSKLQDLKPTSSAGASPLSSSSTAPPSPPMAAVTSYASDGGLEMDGAGSCSPSPSFSLCDASLDSSLLLSATSDAGSTASEQYGTTAAEWDAAFGSSRDEDGERQDSVHDGFWWISTRSLSLSHCATCVSTRRPSVGPLENKLRVAL